MPAPAPPADRPTPTRRTIRCAKLRRARLLRARPPREVARSAASTSEISPSVSSGTTSRISCGRVGLFSVGRAGGVRGAAVRGGTVGNWIGGGVTGGRLRARPSGWRWHLEGMDGPVDAEPRARLSPSLPTPSQRPAPPPLCHLHRRSPDVRSRVRRWVIDRWFFFGRFSLRAVVSMDVFLGTAFQLVIFVLLPVIFVLLPVIDPNSHVRNSSRQRRLLRDHAPSQWHVQGLRVSAPRILGRHQCTR